MTELLAAVKLYVAACGVTRPHVEQLVFTSDLVMHYKTPAQAQKDAAQEALERANKLLKCEEATNKMLDQVEK